MANYGEFPIMDDEKFNELYIDNLDGAVEVLTELCELFFSHGGGLVESGTALFESRDFEGLSRMGHTLKSNAASFGLERLRQISFDIEKFDFAGSDDEAIQEQLKIISSIFDESKDCLAEKLNQCKAAAA